MDAPFIENPLINWSSDIETILENISHNCGLCSEYHKAKYEKLIQELKWYKLPVIILSSLNGLASVTLSSYMEQQVVSLVTAVISLLVGTISSIELYLSIQRRSDSELLSYKSYYTLALKINTTLKLKPEHRHTDGDTFLQTCIGEYESLFNGAQVNGLEDHDQLVELKIRSQL